MKAVLADLMVLVSFDLLKVSERLRSLDDPGERTLMILFTVVSDSVRFLLLVSALALLL